MKGLLQIGKLEAQMPLVYDWLKHAEATRRLVTENYANYSGEELLEITVAENVLTQIKNLETYPVVHSRLYQGKLKIYGWIYLIETGEVLAYDTDKHAYIPPQSQLDYYDEAEGGMLKPRHYSKTQAPPIACELPAIHAEELAVHSRQSTSPSARPPQVRPPQADPARPSQVHPSQPRPSQSGQPARPVPQPASNGSAERQADLAPLWLSPEQAQRIYGGASRSNPSG